MNTADLLPKGLRELAIVYSAEQIKALMIYLEELKKWNRAYNLTGLKTDKDIVIKHFLDSLLYLRAIPNESIHIVDVGTGAGLPGIPIKIMKPGIELSLIESSRKKASFLRHILRTLNLKGVTIREQRIEGLGEEFAKTFDVALSRATYSITEFFELLCPYIKDDGILVLNKGPMIWKELREIDNIPHVKKAVKEILKLRLPIVEAERNLIVLSCAGNRLILRS